MSELDSIAQAVGTVHEQQIDDGGDRFHDDDSMDDLDNQNGDYEVETGW